MDRFDVLIVGAGHAGAECAIALRKEGFEGSIAVVGDEPDLPYERPPLSKDYLSGEKPFERLLIRPPAFWADRSVEFLLGRAVTAISAADHTITLADGATLAYGRLVWAAGGDPRRLTCQGHDLVGLHYVRRRADVDLLKSELEGGAHIVVIGGGYIGLEAAAVMAKLGCKVTVVELLDRVLARVAGEPLSRFYEREHRAHGVDVLLGVGVECIGERDGRVAGVRLATGEVIPAGIVIVGIGIIPSVAPLVAAGAEGKDGVTVDAQCRTSLADVFAIGDCAAHHNRFSGVDHPTRLESVQNAADQAGVVAKTICGKPASYEATPWFWSNQYDLRLQTVGLSRGYTDVVVRGDPADRKFSVVYLRDGRVIALDCVNSGKDYIQGRALVENGTVVPAAALADPETPLKSLVGAA